MEEKQYVPLYKDLIIRWHPSSASIEPTEVVGMYFLRDERGYATRCYQSDGVKYEFPKDLDLFWGKADPRIFFVDGSDRELESVLKYLGEDACTRIMNGYSVSVSGVILSYHGSLFTRVAGGKSLRRVWQLKPFYPSYMIPLDDDCYGVQARGERLVKIMSESGLPLSLNSCGSVLAAMTDLPFNSCSPKVTAYAYNCYHGGWIESMKLGSFEHAYDYDLASAYPSEAAHLYSCSPRCGSWYEVDRFVQEALYGFAYCHINIDLSLPFSPIMVRLRSFMSLGGSHAIRVLRNPIGSWEGWMTNDEIEFVVRNWLGDVEVLSGVWFIPTRYQQPFLPLVSGLNQVRQYAKSKGDKLTSYISKIVPASLQGKFIQSSVIGGERVVGTGFNPVYASAITSRVRLRVAQAALEDSNSILGVVVDGILAEKPLPLGKRWKLEYEGQCVIANHGDYDIEGRDTSLPLRAVLGERERERTYPLRGARYVSLSEAIEAGGFSLACCRRPESYAWVRKVGKRAWDKLPHTCGDLLSNQYESSPLFVGERAGALLPSDTKWDTEEIPEGA